MKIPKSFQLYGQTIHVKEYETLVADTRNVGQARYGDNEIALQSIKHGYKADKSQQEQWFLHELIHFIFDGLGRNELGSNEPLVDTFAYLLHQALSTAKYKEDND